MSDSVKIINVNIPDFKLARIANLSHGIERDFDELVEDKRFEKDIRLVKNLWKWGHHSIFEFLQIIWYIKLPIFSERQLLRHRTFSYNEKSLRYVKLKGDEKIEGYIKEDWNDNIKDNVKDLYNLSRMHYNILIKSGIPAEEARVVLPLGLQTELYMRTDGRNLYNFLKLRLDKHAQEDIRLMAKDMLLELKNNNKTKILYEIYLESLFKDNILKEGDIE